MCLFIGQQTLSEEVSERTHSRMLKLEKENQSLLRIIEELRAASMNSGTQPKHSLHLECDHACQVVRTSSNCTSSTHELIGLQTTCSNTDNHTNVFPLKAVTQEKRNGDSNCHQILNTEMLQGIQSEILLKDTPDLHIQEKGQREDGDRGNHIKELMSDLEGLENNHNRLHCFVGSHDSSPGFKSGSPCHDSIFRGLPTRSSYASKHIQRLEAKCRALDTVNQQLKASLDNTGKDCRSRKH